jgi:hypothetical protein
LYLLATIFRVKRDETAGDWSSWRNEKFYELYFSSNVIRVIKSRRMRCIGHVACMGEGCTMVLVRKLRERDDSEDLGVDGRIILTWNAMNGEGEGTDWIIWLQIRQG